MKPVLGNGFPIGMKHNRGDSRTHQRRRYAHCQQSRKQSVLETGQSHNLQFTFVFSAAFSAIFMATVRAIFDDMLSGVFIFVKALEIKSVKTLSQIASAKLHRPNCIGNTHNKHAC
jgi:hypothetical protein